MRSNNKLLVEQLDKKIKPFQEVQSVVIPSKGWIHTIRTTLNMTMAQLGTKLEITRQGVKSLEENEAKGSITINSLKEAGKVLDLRFVYGFIPKDGSIEKLIQHKAEKLAQKIVLRTNQHMKLEDQGVGDEKLDALITDLAEELKRELKKSLWD
jgi:predicted DNA-binding mobile mystery protein A